MPDGLPEDLCKKSERTYRVARKFWHNLYALTLSNIKRFTKLFHCQFKLLYLSNYISYFNKICRICCVNAHILSLKVWLKYVLPLLKYSIFSRGLFFIGTPCIQSQKITLMLHTITQPRSTDCCNF